MKKRKLMTGTQLRALRKSAKLSQPAAAEQLETPLGTYRGWEQGRRSIPGPAAKLARILFK